MCERLPGGAAGRRIPGWGRSIRDDVLDSEPHGAVTLPHGLAVSCNAYFAQLAVAMGPNALAETAGEFDISVAARDAPAGLRATLPFAGVGQGEVVTTPARLAQVVATIASGGVLAPLKWVQDADRADAAPRRLMTRAAADTLARAMRAVVTSGTGRVLRTNATPIAGKTGTAEVENEASHAWFAGFAPYGDRNVSSNAGASRPRGARMVFVVLVENGGYGGRTAAPIAGAIVDLARQLRMIE
jgi:peptidoglycan glycosyltransferase